MNHAGGHIDEESLVKTVMEKFKVPYVFVGTFDDTRAYENGKLIGRGTQAISSIACDEKKPHVICVPNGDLSYTCLLYDSNGDFIGEEDVRP